DSSLGELLQVLAHHWSRGTDQIPEVFMREFQPNQLAARVWNAERARNLPDRVHQPIAYVHREEVEGSSAQPCPPVIHAVDETDNLLWRELTERARHARPGNDRDLATG